MLCGANCEQGLGGRVESEEKQHENVLNLAQDICAAIANIKTAKQIGAAIHIMEQTHSKDSHCSVGSEIVLVTPIPSTILLQWQKK